MKKWIIIGIGLLAVLGLGMGGWAYSSQESSLTALIEAVKKGDNAAITANVDMPAVKESIKGQLRAQMMAEMQKEGKNADGPEGQMAMGFVNMLIEGLVTPQGLKAIIEEGKLDSPATGAAAKAPNWVIVSKSFGHFEARPQGVATDKATTLGFKMSGLGWKLSSVQIPKSAFDTPKEEAPMEDMPELAPEPAASDE